MHLLTLNAAGASITPARTLDPRRRRLSQVIGRHVDRSRPHMIAVQRARDPLQPIDEAWIVRGRDRAGRPRHWPRRYLPADAIVVVMYLPRGGGGASGSRSKSPLNIALGIAGLALAAFAAPIAAALLPSLIFGSTAPLLLQAGLVIGGTALLSLASRSKATKQATDTTQIFGVAGGGNLPKPGDRIPRGYGRSWMKPDLSQPDSSQYDGDNQILLKRQTIGLGRYRVYQIRAGKQVIWTEAGGFAAPFNDPRNQVEFLYGTPSTLVPGNIVSAGGVGGVLPRPADNPSVAGPFLINQRGALVKRLQIDFQFPQGISRTETLKSGTVRSNQPAAWGVFFEYAPIDASGAITGPWQILYNGNSGAEGARFSTHALRYTKFIDVPAGRYAVRGRNLQPDSTASTSNAAIDLATWDGASGWVDDVTVRPGITELALRIYATQATQAAAFAEIEVDAAAIIPVWTGSSWQDQETSKAVWAYLNIMRDQAYGGAIPDDQLDLGTALGYAQTLSEFDTFDATIRGPVSVYEAAATVLLPMRAEPVHLGRYWSLVRDEPKAIRRHVITRRQMTRGSSLIGFDLDTASGAGHVVGEFDDGGDYRSPGQATAIYGEASLTPTRQRWTGVRGYAHAQHLTRWRAASGAYRRQTTPFGVEMEGRIYRRGDSISVDPWFIDVRRAAGVIDNHGDTLVLDADVVLAAGECAVLRDRGGREWGPLPLAGQGASPREIVLDAAARAGVEAATGLPLATVLSDGRREMTTVLVGALVDLHENYLIQSVKPDGAYRAQVEALIDDPRVWQAIGAPIVVPPGGYTGLRDPESPAILGLTANAVQIAAGWRCDFAIKPGRGAMSFEVGLSYDAGSHFETVYTGTTITGSHVLNPVDPTEVRLRARAFGASGLPGAYFYTALSLGEPKIAGNLLKDLEAQFDQVGLDFLALQALIDELATRANQSVADALKQAVSQQRQLAEAVARLRADVQDIAEAAATVEGANYDSRVLLKAALEGRTQDAFAAIETEKSLRVSADETQASTSTLLATRLGTAEGAIRTETLARTTADDAQAGQITTAYARLTSAELNISGQASAQMGLTTRVTTAEGGIVSLSQQYTTLNSGLTDANGRITANAGAISSLTTLTTSINGTLTSQGQQLTTLSSAVNNPSTGLAATGSAVSSLTTRTTTIEGQAANLGTVVNNQAQAIVGLNSAITNPSTGLSANASAINLLAADTQNLNNVVGAQATSLQQLSSTVGGHTSTLSVVGQSIGGLQARFSVLGNINGVTGGFQMFGVAKNDGSVAYNFEILGNLVVDGSIGGRKLAAYEITSEKLTTGQLIVNGQLFDNAATQTAIAASGGQSVSVGLTVRGASSRVLVQAYFNGRSNVGSTNGPGDFVIQRDGGEVLRLPAAFALFKPDSGNLQYYLTAMAVALHEVPGAGGHTYTVVHTNGHGAGGVTAIVTEFSK